MNNYYFRNVQRNRGPWEKARNSHSGEFYFALTLSLKGYIRFSKRVEKSQVKSKHSLNCSNVFSNSGRLHMYLENRKPISRINLLFLLKVFSELPCNILVLFTQNTQPNQKKSSYSLSTHVPFPKIKSKKEHNITSIISTNNLRPDIPSQLP